MIIYNNDKELKSPYSKQETKIIEINSPLSLQEIYEKLVNGEELNPEQIVVNCYKFKDGDITFYNNEDIDNSNEYIYDTILSEDDVDALYEKEYQRDDVFEDFEKFQFAQPCRNTYVLTSISSEELLVEIKAALGCLPTLIDKPLNKEELSKYVSAGSELICPSYSLSSTNPAPTIQEIDHYISMNDYEKRLIRSYKLHPHKVLKIAEGLKEKISPKYVLSKDIYEDIRSSTVDRNIDRFLNDINTIFDANQQEIIQNAFKAVPEFHGFVPRVANEYILGRLLRDDIPTFTLNSDLAFHYAKEFNRNSVSKIANTKSPVLLGLSNVIDFGQFPEKQRDVIASYLSRFHLHTFEEKHFVDWINQNKNVNPTELVQLIENVDKLQNFDLNRTAKQFIAEIKDARGIIECKKFENNETYRLKFEDNELAIKGRHTVAKQGNITMRMLQADDYGHFTAGIDTTCCQRYGDAGASCVYKAVTDPFATTVVIEEGDKVKAQGFVWTDELTNTLVFDNIEFCGNDALDTQLSKKYLNIIYEWAKAMPYDNVHIGVGYNASMNGWGRQIKEMATLPTTLSARHCYSDYHGRARAIKENGEMLLRRTSNIDIIVETAPDEPTRWDELASPALSFMLNKCDKTIEERLDFARRFVENPDSVNQLEVIQLNPKAISAIDNPTRDVQLYILDNHPDLCNLIKNPILEVKYHNIKENPSEIQNLSYEELTPEVLQLAVENDGLALQYIPVEKRTLGINTIAVRQNPNAIQFVTDITEDLQVEVAASHPKSLLKLNHVCERALLTALEKEPSLISVMNNVTHNMKMLAVEKQPDLILSIKNPIIEGETQEEHNQRIKDLWTSAVSGNPYLIRNCGRSFPDLRMPAIEKNPYVITILIDSNKEEITKAVSLDKNVWQMIKHPERQAYAYQKACEIYGVDNVPIRKRPNIQRQPVQEQEL